MWWLVGWAGINGVAGLWVVVMWVRAERGGGRGVGSDRGQCKEEVVGNDAVF